MRAALSLFIGIMGIVLLAAMLSACAAHPPEDLAGGLGFDALGMILQGVAGN